MTLVETNVLVDRAADPRWTSWSEQALDMAAIRRPLCINGIVFAELSIGFDNIEDEAYRADLPVRLLPMPFRGS